jgi:transposase
LRQTGRPPPRDRQTRVDQRRLCEEVHLNLPYRCFCRVGLDDTVPEHSTFSKNRPGRFRESDAFPHVFETVLQRCINEGLVGGEGFAIDASVVKPDAARDPRCRNRLPRTGSCAGESRGARVS